VADSPRDLLATECTTFIKYLVGRSAPPDVVAAYQQAHEVSAVERAGRAPSLDRSLLRLARVGPASARVADAYAAVFARASVLRRKLVLLVAILESRGETAPMLDTAHPGPRARWFLEVGLRAIASVLMLCIAALVILPLTLWYRLSGAAGSDAGPRTISSRP
jgi:hypothetical protein